MVTRSSPKLMRRFRARPNTTIIKVISRAVSYVTITATPDRILLPYPFCTACCPRETVRPR